MYNRKLGFALRNKFKDITEDSGIYLWTRKEGEITYFYVGQAKNLRNRRTDYEMVRIGKQYPSRHFEASLRKHKDGVFTILETCPVGLLDYCEEKRIKEYMCMPNYVTRNESLTGNEGIVQSNYRRKEQIEKKVILDLKKCLGYLNYSIRGNWLVIGYKYTKKGIPTKLSSKYFDKLCEMLGIERGNNEKDQEIQKPI